MSAGGDCTRDSGKLAAVPSSSAKADVVIETIYTGLLIAVFLAITWFACYVVYKLYHGQR